MVSHSPDRTRELLNHALRALACGSGDLAARLKNAHSDALIQFLGGTTEMESVSEELRDLMDYFAQEPKTGLQIFESLPADTLREIAVEIFELFFKVSRRV